ncbi:MAG: T9SS type A sorting domain-containing protein [Paludibacteraceae bacterium]|nr:T9SS type A sorting domain-containing protein [Paludibacteraceae bacterium]
MSKKIVSIKVIFCLMMLMLTTTMNAQISQGGIPYSLLKNKHSTDETMRKIASKADIPIITMPSVDNNSLLSKDGSYDNESYNFAKEFDFTINIKESSVVDSISEGFLYRCAIESPTAFSIHLVFSKFHIPIGAKLFLYDESAEQILGAFTSNNNKESYIFAVAPIFDDRIIVEYFEPYYAEFEGIVEVGQVYHGFIDISEDVASSLAGTCEVDINCSEGDNWQTEKKAVCRIVFGDFTCSGALINNTNYDGTPYFLTANHCISTEEDAQKCIFCFNYENKTCGVYSISSVQTLSGATLKATSTNTDFTLLKMLEVPNITCQPYYAGWDRNISHGEGGVGIHHPKSLPKKISTYETAQKSPSCHDLYPANFYLIDEWIETEHGHGVTEKGSSGSPLFNNKHRIIGQLYGGCYGHNDNCNDPSNDYSLYGKFHLSWDSGDSAATRLKDWLDPTNKNYMCIDGLSTCDSSGIIDVSIHHSAEDDGVVALYSRDFIESMATIDSGAIVSYVAKDYIKLNNGFLVRRGAEFRASISSNLCNSFAPISIANWTPNLSDQNILEYNVTNATRYKILVHSISGELIYFNQDTILSNNIIVWQYENFPKSTDKFLVTIAFYNNNEEISNTYVLNSDVNTSRLKVSNLQNLDNINIEDNNTLDFHIHSNQTTESVGIEVVANKFTPYNLSVFSISGQCMLVLDYINTNKMNININNLPAGEYVVQIQMGSNSCSKKILKF